MDINIVKLKKYASKCSVLYVEDDEIIRTQTASFLGRFFTDVVLAEDGVIGLAKYKERKFDVVITDINMPNMNGIEMIEAIKEILYTQIILVTSAHNDSEYLMKLINLDVSRFVLKPFNNKQFLYVLYKIAEELTFENERKELQEEVVSLSKNAQIIVDEIKIGIITIKDNEVNMANRAFLDIGGFDSYDTLKLEMPEIGVLFEEASHCVNATSNKDLIEQLEQLGDDEKKVRIIKDTKTYEYQVTSTKLEEENSYILTFSDITAIHNALYNDEHTKLPIRKFVLEKIELLKQGVSELGVIIVRAKNFENIAKWYGKAEATAVEVEFSTIVKAVKNEQLPNAFIGYFAENQIVIISDKYDMSETYKILKGIDISTETLFTKHDRTDLRFHLSTQAEFLKLDTSKELNALEVDLINAFDFMQ
ncbi:response regulator [Sulfurimonas sp. CS5]|uniref:response regulator n=1 Tax=Sulfurimonas sp. CS5 TaxID=3391145 RepID=UPI0039EC3695